MSETNKSIVQDCHTFEEAFHNAQGDGFENRHPQFQHGFDQGFKAAWQAKQDVGEWVKCSERLPEEGVPVLTITDYGGWDVCHRRGDMWLNSMRAQHSNGGVTHWQPLPQPPGEQS